MIAFTIHSTTALAQGPLTNGQNHTGTISAAGEDDTWSFTATQGDAIALAIGESATTDTSLHPWIRLYAPDGTRLDSEASGRAAQINRVAPATGTYTVLVATGDYYHVGIGGYLLTLAKMPGTFVVTDSGGGAMTNGQNHTGTITLGDLDQWSFTATQGDAIALAIGESATTDTSLHPWIRLYAPDGTRLDSEASGRAAQINRVAPATGTYTVLVATGDYYHVGIGGYLLTLAKMPGTFVVTDSGGGAMTNGQNHTGTITLGDLDQWSFTATQGDAIALAIGESATTDTSLHPWIRLYAPDGTRLDSEASGRAAQINRVAPATGTYTVLVATGDYYHVGIGGYLLTLAKMPGTFVVTDSGGGPLTKGNGNRGAITLGDLDQWTLRANQGENIILSIDESATTDTSLHPWIRLYAPDGTRLDSEASGRAAQINRVAPATGTYTVLVATGDYYHVGIGGYVITSSHGGGSIKLSPEISGKLLGNPNPACSSGSIALSRPGCVGVGNPIAISSGNKFEQVTDYETATSAKLGFTRYYNSHVSSGADTFASSLGLNWRGTYDRYIRIDSATAVAAERPDGRVLNFTLQADVWTPDSDVDLKLRKSGSTWTLTDANDTIETYTDVSGTQARLTSIKHRAGYTQTLVYNGAQLQTVTDSFGRALQFAYEGGLLRTLTTPDNQTFNYAYTAVDSASRLTSVTYSTAPPTSQTYLYENATYKFALTAIQDENGNRYAAWTYDAEGRATSSQHAGGAERTTISYNADGSRTVTHPLGQKEQYQFTTLQGMPKVTRIDRLATTSTAAAMRTFTYDANGYLASETDWNGNRTTYVNDARGLPTTIVEAAGTPLARTTTFSYRGAFHVPTKKVQEGLTTDFVSEPSTGNLLTMTLTDTTDHTVPYSTRGTKRTWTYTWAPNGLLASIKGPRSDVNGTTSFTYDADGTLMQTTNALGHETRITKHTPGGLPQTIIDANDVTTRLTYDARLRLTSSAVSTAAGLRTTNYAYDAAGNRLSVTLPDGSRLTHNYDAAHRLTSVTDLANQRASFTLDALGGRTQTSVVNTNSTVKYTHTAAFDALGRPLQNTGGAGQATQSAYDANGNAVSLLDPLNRETRQAFDALNRLFRVTDPLGGVALTSFDEHDRPLSVTAPNGTVTTYVYSGFGDLIQTQSPDSGTTVYRYDASGNLVQKTDATGAVANYTHDALDRVLTVRYPAAANEGVTYRYDQAGAAFRIGRLGSVTDAAGSLARSYDERGNLVREQRVRGSLTLPTSYSYDAASRLSGITYPSGARVTYVRNITGRVTDVSLRPQLDASPQTVLSNVRYEPFGPVRALIFGNGINGTRTHDLDYRLTQLTDEGVQNLTYSYNPADSVLTLADGITSGASQNFGYDTLDRLMSATGIYGSQSWTYDGVGNRLTQQGTGGNVSYTYAPQSNRLTQVNTGSVMQALSYTAAGSVSGVVQSGQPTTSLVYTQAGRLARVLNGSQPTLEYAYDAFGRRIVKAGAGSTTTLYQYDPQGHLLAEVDGAGTAKTDYLYLDDQPIATYAPSTGTLSFLHTDRVGTPQKATNTTRSIVWKANYQPFGGLHTPSSQTASLTQNLRFPGQEFESETGWHQNGFRDYAPTLGRYLESDPIGLVGGLNPYSYVDNNPLARIDPTGTSWTEVLKAATVIHYNRNWFNASPSLATAQRLGWRKMDASESVFHLMGDEANRHNQKYVSPDGRQEAVYSPAGCLVTDSLNRGSFNFASPYWLGGIPHFAVDVVPYFFLGNSPQDLLMPNRFLVAAQVVGNKVESWAGPWLPE